MQKNIHQVFTFIVHCRETIGTCITAGELKELLIFRDILLANGANHSFNSLLHTISFKRVRRTKPVTSTEYEKKLTICLEKRQKVLEAKQRLIKARKKWYEATN